MKWVSGDFKNSLIQYLRLTELLQAGVPLSENQELQYNVSRIAVGVWNQTTPRFYEENILLMLAANMKLLCFNHTKVSINLFLQEMYKDPILPMMVLDTKHQKTNTKLMEKLAAFYLVLIKEKVENNRSL